MVRCHPDAIDLDDVLLALRQQAVVADPFHAIPKSIDGAYGFDRPPSAISQNFRSDADTVLGQSAAVGLLPLPFLVQ